ncbi:uncharacterized protein ACA1_181380 [Acanthamoeba castellanii str. Neff]|uniref:Clu domain-containing protein n=1 Tax=Acanthamoeba castellanii (strain ATCC 30010 / Neff) TaxID=1257118 RepID=L8H6W7_ACACF|nr:uncharacterized protein ACA1_181380 [Acanthamoeba castellanii str. Neff]ELR21259.1 hypothetical protein ACA1_181380 [Acanthamoeba castellanii str. Neff]
MFVTFTPGLPSLKIEARGIPLSGLYPRSRWWRYRDIPELNEAMTTACSPLAICGHKAKDKTIHGPSDFEAHRSTDGRNYVVDFARLLPPQSPSEEYRLSHS